MAEQEEAELLRWLDQDSANVLERIRVRGDEVEFIAPDAYSAIVRRIIAERDAAQRVARELVDFHNDYKRNTLGCDMPGNDLYSGLLMDIVRRAHEALNGGTHEQN